ncbi:hypothetical protein B7494_g325 [Chlorociboria aeruginascens]|nr:hypothetical protein B7494_g325 [Chlorociboria aeruginascens]
MSAARAGTNTEQTAMLLLYKDTINNITIDGFKKDDVISRQKSRIEELEVENQLLKMETQISEMQQNNADLLNRTQRLKEIVRSLENNSEQITSNNLASHTMPSAATSTSQLFSASKTPSMDILQGALVTLAKERQALVSELAAARLEELNDKTKITKLEQKVSEKRKKAKDIKKAIFEAARMDPNLMDNRGNELTDKYLGGGSQGWLSTDGLFWISATTSKETARWLRKYGVKKVAGEKEH